MRRAHALVSAFTCCATVLFALCTLATQNVFAIGLGPASVTSALGEPLRLSVPVTLQPDEELGCIQVRPGNGDLPSVFNTRAQVIRAGNATRIEIRSAQPVNEPAIDVVVSVGCTSPIARDYVLFMDPPVIAPIDQVTAAGAPLRRVNPMPTPVRRVPRAAPAPRAASLAGDEVGRSEGPARARPARPARPGVRAPLAAPPVDAAAAAPAASAPRVPSTRAAVAPAPASNAKDRLSVVPTEPAVTAAAPAASATSPAVGSAPAVDTAAAAANAAAEAAAHEEALRQQQAALQTQIKLLADQISALRVQATTLAERNRLLEQGSPSPWWLIALSAAAILLAAWMAWRYLQLRRSIEGSAWWTNNPAQPAGPTTSAAAAAATAVPAARSDEELDPGTRIASRSAVPTDLRGAAVPVSTVQPERPKTVVRPTKYPAAIDTDFTVSDIEAAMATVRTVSPPRPAASSTPLGDSDFAPLGGPTLPSPFADPPPGAPGSAPPKAPARMQTDASSDDVVSSGQFVDFDIPLIKPLVSAGGKPQAPAAGAPFKSADFLLDEPTAFDPLATDSLKTTVVDGLSQSLTNGPEKGVPSSLDFELPTTTQIMALSSHGEQPPVSRMRHAGTLLDDLFESSDGPGTDTILDLDERHGEPLSMTEVDRLITTDAEGEPGAVRSPRSRMAKFADLMNRVDEVAAAEPLRAIAQLRQFVLRDDEIPTLLWLRLFELYRQVDKKPVYNALAEHFARRYHRPMVAWGRSLADHVPQTPLSAHPDIDGGIEASWGTEDGRIRLEHLICGHDLDDTIVFNAVLQHDLLDAAKIFPVTPAGETAAPYGGAPSSSQGH